MGFFANIKAAVAVPKTKNGGITINKNNVHESLLSIVESDPNYSDGRYIKYMMENAQKVSSLISYEDIKEFAGILSIADKYGKDEALEKFGYLINDWIEKGDEELQWRYMDEIPFFCGALYANEIVTREESDKLEDKYCRTLEDKLFI